MRKAFVLAAVVLLGSVSLAQAEDLSFNLINKTGVDIVGFYVSHTGTDEWEENMIEGHYLPGGNQILVSIRDGRTVCEYDMRAEFADGDVLEEYELDLCSLGSYTFQ